MLDNAWIGYNAALFAYGQTGSGKSYSMVGYGPNGGIVPMTCTEMFKRIKADSSAKCEFQVTFSMFEIYNEKVRNARTHAARCDPKARARRTKTDSRDVGSTTAALLPLPRQYPLEVTPDTLLFNVC